MNNQFEKAIKIAEDMEEFLLVDKNHNEDDFIDIFVM